MTDQSLERILRQKSDSGRKNVSLVLSPSITRASLRLKKRRRDRINLLMLILAAAGFLLTAIGLIVAFSRGEAPASRLTPALYWVLGGMGLTLLLSPALAWVLESDN